MRNVNSGASPSNEQRLINAMNAYLHEPEKPTGFTLKESVINLLGGPADALGTEYDYRDTCEVLVRMAEASSAALGHRKDLAVLFLNNALSFFNDCIASESLRAEIHRDVIEIWGCKDMTPAAVENLIKQYELKRQLTLLEAEAANLQRKAA